MEMGAQAPKSTRKENGLSYYSVTQQGHTCMATKRTANCDSSGKSTKICHFDIQGRSITGKSINHVHYRHAIQETSTAEALKRKPLSELLKPVLSHSKIFSMH